MPMIDQLMTAGDLAGLLRAPYAEERLSAALGTPLALVRADAAGITGDLAPLRRRAAALNCVLVGVAGPARTGLAPPVLDLFDVVIHDGTLPASPPGGVLVHDLEAALGGLADAVTARPLAAVTLAVLLRGTGSLTPDQAIAAESAAYSTLQAGPEFASWLAARAAPSRRPAPEPAVVAARHGAVLRLTLNAPGLHNAYSMRMRDELCEYLTVADSDESVATVVIDGAGPSFCSGGYLGEFGLLPDPATAHIVRLTRSAGRLIARMSSRVEVRLHGAAMGAGIELAAFAGRVVADPATRIALPELALGLLPGAGGTVSIPRRIGRQRTAYLALSGATLDAGTALAWGLIDAIQARQDWPPA